MYILFTPPNSEIICGENVGTKVVRGMILFFEKKAMLKINRGCRLEASPFALKLGWIGCAI